MRKLLWFTNTNISTKDHQDYSFELTKYLNVFVENKLWKKRKYHSEYNHEFGISDLQSIESIKIHIHNQGAPFSNLHSYESLINQYVDIDNIEQTKVSSSGISEAHKIAVIEVEYRSDNKLISSLSYEAEKDIDLVSERLSEENRVIWVEQNNIKTIVIEFVQFYIFNLHLNFLTQDYGFNFTKKHNPIGFTLTSEKGENNFNIDKIELLSHYILYEKENDNLENLMNKTSKFWCNYNPSIHFFLEALKGDFVTAISYTKLVFTLESFFSKNTSNDFITLIIPLLISNNVTEMKKYREIIKISFNRRNDIVHGSKMIDLVSKDDMISNFFELKNVVTRIFYFMINDQRFTEKRFAKINHELIFELLPNGIIKKEGL